MSLSMKKEQDIKKITPEELLQMQRLYEEVVRRHARLIRYLCAGRSGGDGELCKDLIQEVSIGLWLHLDSYRSGRLEGAWVYWRARKVLNDYFSHRLPSPERLSIEIANTVAEEACEGREQLEDIMSHLDPDERRLLELRLEETGVEEIAASLQCSTSAVYKRLRRVMVKAREINEKLNQR